MDADAKARLARVKDPELRRLLVELYPLAMANEHGPRFAARERRRVMQKREEDNEWAHALTASALRGVFGSSSQKLAEKYTDKGQNIDDASCWAAAQAVCQLPEEDRRRVRE